MIYYGRSLFLLLILLSSCSITDNQDNIGIIVSKEWLQTELDHPSLVLLHVGTEEVYDSIHIPGSLFIDPYEFTVSSGGLRNQLPELDTVLSLLGSVGVDKESRIVLYSESEDLRNRTARVFLTLDYAGFGDQCHILNGGLEVWYETDTVSYQVTNKVTNKVTGDKEVTGDKKVIILADELNQQRWNQEYVIVDVRSEEEYFGEIDSAEQVGTGGHIEGAYFMDYHFLLSESNPQLFKKDEELLKEFKKAGMDSDKTTVFYCGSGIRASLAYLAARHLNFPVRLYDGSIEDWESQDLPQTSPVITPTPMK